MQGNSLKTVLLVDDDPLLRAGIARNLAARGIDVRSAVDGLDGLQAARTARFDLILLDVELPERSGAQVLQHLRASPNTARTKVYLLAESGDSVQLDLAMHHGADGVFRKDRMSARDIALEVALMFGAGSAGGDASGSAGTSRGSSAVPEAVDRAARRLAERGDDTTPHGQPHRQPHKRPDRPSLTTTPIWANPRRGKPLDAVDVFQTNELIETRDGTETGAVSRRRFGPRPASTTELRGPISVEVRRAAEHPGGRAITVDLSPPRTDEIPQPSAPLPSQPISHAISRESGQSQTQSFDILQPLPDDVEESDPGYGDMARGLATDAELFETGEIRLSQTSEIRLKAPPPRLPGRSFGDPSQDVYAGLVNPLIGGVARLAETLGHPGNLMCPMCGVQMLLQMRIDDLEAGTVKGHFACPKCASK